MLSRTNLALTNPGLNRQSSHYLTPRIRSMFWQTLDSGFSVVRSLTLPWRLVAIWGQNGRFFFFSKVVCFSMSCKGMLCFGNFWKAFLSKFLGSVCYLAMTCFDDCLSPGPAPALYLLSVAWHLAMEETKPIVRIGRIKRRRRWSYPRQNPLQRYLITCLNAMIHHIRKLAWIVSCLGWRTGFSTKFLTFTSVVVCIVVGTLYWKRNTYGQ